MIPSSDARTLKQNIAQFLSNIAQNIATDLKQNLGPVTKIENIKTDATKILRPTHFGE
jgi:hypothetical protein